MDEDATATPPIDPDDPQTIQWRRDASTSRTVRLLWSLGVGTFFAAIGIIVFWRLYDFAGQIGGQFGQSVVLAVLAAAVVTALALAVASDPERRLERLLGSLPLSIGSPTGRGLERALDAAVGTIAMGVLIAALMAVGRLLSQADTELGGVLGTGVFTGLAALTIPVALVVLVLASFLRSVGAVDREEETVYLFDPDHRIDLEVIDDVSVRHVGDAAIVKLSYRQPGGQYVAGPRRIAVPPSVAEEITELVESRP